MERCNIITKSGERCQRLTSLVERTHLQMYSKKSTKGRTFKLGEVWELKNNKWAPVCKLHFNMYLHKKDPPLK